MKVFQTSITEVNSIQKLEIEFEPNLLLVFMSPFFKGKQQFIEWLVGEYPTAFIFGCSTAGEIMGGEVLDGSVALTAIHFEKTILRVAFEDLQDDENASGLVGQKLAQSLHAPDLRHVFVLSDGLNINGADLVNGLRKDLPENVSVTGGLAADGARFESTFIICKRGIIANRVAAIGFYGKDLKIGYGSKGGWDSFGMERLVTRAKNNVLYELDGAPALALYESFLGEKAKDLPQSGLLFPLSMRNEENEMPVVRTILRVNREEQSLTFAGNITEGSYVRLMKANVDRIIDGAEQSAETSRTIIPSDSQLAILISCVGRRLVLKQLIEEEVDAVKEVLGKNVPITGFYSYGEIAPFDQFSACTLHNQTMTVTTFAE